MTDRVELVSPCTGVCTMDPETGFCLGCWRTIDEISTWPDVGDDGKIEILERLRARQSAAGVNRRRVTRRRRLRGVDGV